MRLPDLRLLDTGILVLYARGGRIARWIEDTHRLMESPDRPLISIITCGEALSFARKREWGEARVDQLRQLVRHAVVVGIDDGGILDAYVETDYYSTRRRPSVEMGKNDLWIAATARALRATLLTIDRDFDHLHPDWIRREYIDQARVGP